MLSIYMPIYVISSCSSCYFIDPRNSIKHHYEIRAGMYRRSTFSPTVQHSVVEEIFLHPNFTREPLVNDIALLRLQTPLYFNR